MHQEKGRKLKRCSYCLKYDIEDTTHDRRACHRLESDRDKFIPRLAAWREEKFERIKAVGAGVGALVHFRPAYLRTRHLCIIQEIDWARLSMGRWHTGFGYKFLQLLCLTTAEEVEAQNIPHHSADPGHPRNRPLSRDWWVSAHKVVESGDQIAPVRDWEVQVDLLLPASKRAIESSVPPGWLDGTLGVDWFFSQR